LDEPLPTKEMRDVLNCCNSRGRLFITGCDANTPSVESHIYTFSSKSTGGKKKSPFATPRKLTGNPIRITLN
jgi:hypothetical protein